MWYIYFLFFDQMNFTWYKVNFLPSNAETVKSEIQLFMSEYLQKS